MKWTFKYNLVAILVLIIQSAYSQTYTWTRKNNFGGGLRYDAFFFTINGKGYAGSGIDGGGATLNYIYTDLWEYNDTTDTWTQKANMPGLCKRGTASFSIANFGYVTTGWSPAQSTETWEYNSLTNSWSAKANFAGAARYNTAFFVIGNYAYAGMGYNPYTTDFWKYDQQNDTWSQIANIGGQPRSAGTGFAINGVGYVFGGGQLGGPHNNQVWQYDTSANAWSIKTFCPCYPRSASAVFTIGNDAFIGLGADDTSTFQDFYRYNPLSNTWQQLPDFGGGKRLETFAFSLGNNGYVGTGSSLIYPNLTLLQDVWQLSLNTSTFSHAKKAEVNLFPNPNNGNFYIQTNLAQLKKIDVFNSSGQLVYSNSNKTFLAPAKLNLNLKHLISGIYTLKLSFASHLQTIIFEVL